MHTHTPRILKARRAIIELMVANHPQDCLVCHRSGTCELADSGPRAWRAQPKQYVGMKRRTKLLDISSPAIWRDHNKCVLCGRCVTMCNQIQGIGAIDFIDRGFPHPNGAGFSKGSTSGGYMLRAMRAGLPDRRPHGTGHVDGWWRRWATRHRGSRADSPGGPRHPRRGRPPGRPAMLEHLAAGPQTDWLRRGLRHGLRRRPHHHGGGHRTGRPGAERRPTADVHQLFPGLGAVRGVASTRPDPHLSTCKCPSRWRGP